MLDRRGFVALSASVAACGAWAESARRAIPSSGKVPRFGMVTYLWGRDLPLPELLAACDASGLEGVELRTTHAHGVEPTISEAAGADIRKRFADSSVELVGLGSNERFDSPDPARLAAAMEATRGFLRCSAAVGGGGVKVKPDSFHRGIDPRVTIEQIGASLRELGPSAADLGQEIRLEVHGGCANPSIIREIIDLADHPAVRACWNCNPRDLQGQGFLHHYDLLRPVFGGTLHVRELDALDYPIGDLLDRVQSDGYGGFVLLEAHSDPPPRRVPALSNQRALFDVLRRPRAPRRNSTIRIAPRRNAPNVLEVKAGNEAFATVRLVPGERTPSIHPLHAPGERPVLRGFPFDRREHDATDHPHHRGMWVAHGDVGGHDFWHDPSCRIKVRSHEIVGDDVVRLEADWLSPDGPLARETRTLRFSAGPRFNRVDTAIELVPLIPELVFGDTKEGTFALRLAPSLRVDGPVARGRLENAEGVRDKACWGLRSSSVTAEGPIDGRLVRVTVVDDDSNPWSPSHWHARTYGLLAMNPFGRRAFEGSAARSGAMTLTPDRPLRCGYSTILETGLPAG
ncbi:MAG: TIM barrel protein [Phycisphaera sp.]|nr:TIM barrel protein [Phycisphaera sp.]